MKKQEKTIFRSTYNDTTKDLKVELQGNARVIRKSLLETVARTAAAVNMSTADLLTEMAMAEMAARTKQEEPQKEETTND